MTNKSSVDLFLFQNSQQNQCCFCLREEFLSEYTESSDGKTYTDPDGFEFELPLWATKKVPLKNISNKKAGTIIKSQPFVRTALKN
ncbi:hypothetical protein EFK69_07915 [Lactococcus lactis subsp. lactis]|nr:hypothetical protein [Lactococcus lactis subsp. lactis]